MDQFQEDGRHAVARSELISRRIATDNPKNSSLARHVEKPPFLTDQQQPDPHCRHHHPVIDPRVCSIVVAHLHSPSSNVA